MGLHQQLVIERHQGHQQAVGRHHAADGSDLQALDHAPHRRLQCQAIQ
ncbi:hypothetical protein SDC9_153087 [bioreactor metagenome]|uniref:Uncharacterized protein n=1 Tax=bioreactor metagenome TaxID=1076179 RepID=A0A645EZK0_9ZZZZ